MALMERSGTQVRDSVEGLSGYVISEKQETLMKA